MEGDRRSFFNKLSSPQFKRKGESTKRGKWSNTSHRQDSEDFHASDTVYRILCQSKKIGSVIGKGGDIIKSLREETQAKITVADSVPGSDERVILVFSPSSKSARRNTYKNDQDPADTETDDRGMAPHCAAQDALLRVHDRIIDEDLGGGTTNEDVNEISVTARLLVPNNLVGCLLGRKGDVIQRLRSETGATIRILPADHLPACAMSTDELVQISGKPALVRKALYEVSTLLHQNPRKDKPPSSIPVAHGTQGHLPPGNPLPGMLRDSTWPTRNLDPDMPPMPWMGGYDNLPSRFGPSELNGVPLHDGETPAEFTMKILCSAGKIGGVIGKGGFNVKQLQQETGASIHVEDVSPESDERVIRVSSHEALSNPRSQTIDAILHLQNKTSEYSEKGTITTRLLVPSSKVGCILGQGGHVINEMRRRTQADIRVYSKEEKPKCASQDEELVQVSGSINVARDALAEVASRLRARCLRDAHPKPESAPLRPVQEFGPGRSLSGGGPAPSSAMRSGSSSRYELLKGGAHDYKPPGYLIPPSTHHEYEHPSYSVPRSPIGYLSSSMDGKIPRHTATAVMGTGGSSMREIAGSRLNLQDPYSGGGRGIHGYSEQLSSDRSNLQAFGYSGGHDDRFQEGGYRGYNPPQLGSYRSSNPPQTQYQNYNPQPPPYDGIHKQQGSYYNLNSQGSYQY